MRLQRFLSLLLLSGLVLCSVSAQTVEIRKPNGAYWQGSLRSHPRIFIDDLNASQMIDPDGDGPQRAPRANLTNPAYQAAWARADWARKGGTLGTYREARFMFPALLYLMDHNASWSKSSNGEHRNCTSAMLANEASDPTRDCLIWWALDQMRNVDKYWQDVGHCDFAEGMCGWAIWPTTDTDYFGATNIYLSMAYSILRDRMTPVERQKFTAVVLNGVFNPVQGEPGAFCESRTFHGARQDGYLSFEYGGPISYALNQWTATWTGSPLSPSLIGKWVSGKQRAVPQTVTNSSPVTPAQGYVSFQNEGLGLASSYCSSSSGTYIPSTPISVSNGFGHNIVLGKKVAFYNTTDTVMSLVDESIALTVNDGVQFFAGTGGILPAQITEGQTYYIQAVKDYKTFYLSATPGGARIDITTASTGEVWLTVPNRNGTCHAEHVTTASPMAVYRIDQIGPYSNGQQSVTVYGAGFFRLPYKLSLWEVPDWNNNLCGWGQSSKWHGDAPTYTGSSTDLHGFRLAAPINASQTTIRVDATDAPKLQSLPVPFLVSISTFTYFKEIVKVTAVAGDTLTVVRGYHGTIPRAAGAGRSQTKGWDAWVVYGNPGKLSGWNNRNLSRSTGFLTMAVAFADDDPRAARALKEIMDYFYTNAYPAEVYYGMNMQALGSYDYSRMIQFWSLFSMLIRGATNGEVDYTQSPWMRDFIFKRPLYFSTPWSPYHHINFGVTADNCKVWGWSIGDSGCEIQAWISQAMYRNEPDAKRLWKYATETLSKDGGYPKGLYSYDWLRYSDRGTLYALLYVNGDEEALDYTDQPSSIVYPASTDPANLQYGMFIHRTDWSTDAAYLAGIAWTQFGEKFFDPIIMNYTLGKKSFFIGQQSDGYIDFAYYGGDPNGYDMRANTAATILVGELPGNIVKANSNATNAANGIGHTARARWDRRLVNSKVTYARNAMTGLWKHSNLQVNGTFRNLIAFKGGGEDVFIVHDDVSTNSNAEIRTQIPYQMDGGTKVVSMDETGYIAAHALSEGITQVNLGTRQIHSTFPDGNVELVTDIVKGSDGPDGFISTIGSNFLYVTSPSPHYDVTIGTRCSADNPCQLRFGGVNYNIVRQGSLTISNNTSSEALAWYDPADQQFHIAPKAGSPSFTNCLDIVCETTPVTEIPAGTWLAWVGKWTASGGWHCSNTTGSANCYPSFSVHPNIRMAFTGQKARPSLMAS